MLSAIPRGSRRLEGVFTSCERAVSLLYGVAYAAILGKSLLFAHSQNGYTSASPSRAHKVPSTRLWVCLVPSGEEGPHREK